MLHTPYKLSLLALLASVSCGGPAKKSGPGGGNAGGDSNAALAEVGIDGTAMDTSASPCDDFYQYACGGWLAKTEIPADEAGWVRSFSVIDEENQKHLRTILDAAAANKNDDKLGAFWAACMDEGTIEKAGATPIEPFLGKVAEVKDKKSLLNAVILLHQHGIWPLWQLSAEQDFKNATTVIAYFDQGGLGLPDRDFYIDEDKKPLREFYVGHVERMMGLAGFDAAAAKQAAADVMSIETELAKVSKTRVEQRDPAGLYNKMDRAGLRKMAPNIDWNRYFDGMSGPEVADANVTAPKFFERVSQLLASVKPAQWRNYLAWHVVADQAPALSKPFVDERFSYSQAITGTKELPPRWKRCVSATDGALGELLGERFAADRFNGDSQQAAEAMVLGIKAAFGENLERLNWMDAGTRARAKEKMESMIFKIGKPKTPREYSFAVTDQHALNQQAAAFFEIKRQVAKMGKPVDREEWGMSAATVNAYYNPLINEMVFPAGILQPPFYSSKNAVAVNLGAIGMVVGHELTHGFDDSGAKFAADGNMTDWWDPAVKEQFQKKTQCVVKQYASYEPMPGVKLNGELTQGENIADIGGIKMALHAYRAMRAGKPPIVAGGFSEDQLFFLGHAQAWCGKYRPELQKLLVTVDPHSPGRFRVNGPLSATPEFAKAFSCPANAPMAPAARCEVW